MKFDNSVFQMLALITQLGASILTPIILCAFVGTFLEKRFELPFTVPLIIIGLLSGIRNAYYLLRRALKETKGGKNEKRK